MAIRHVLLRIAYRLAVVYWFFFRPTATGSYVALWHQGRLLMIENSYRSGWTFPSGGKKRNETHKEAAIRELWEEVRVRASADQLVETEFFFTTLEFKRDRSVVFEFYPTEQPEIQLDDFEVIEAQWVPFATLTESQLKLVPIVQQYVDWKRSRLN